MDETTKQVKPNERVIRLSRWKTAIVVIILAIIAFYLWGMQRTYMTNSVAPTMSYPSVMEQNADSSYGATSVRYPNYPTQSPTITDTREFLKTSYSANIKTRDVPEVVTNVKNIIKGADGRIDNIYSSEHSGQVSFVVAKSKFDAFKVEIEALTNAKLYSETVSSQNLLGQKQNIEQRTDTVLGTLSSLKAQRESLATKHTQTLARMQPELTRVQAELAAVRVVITNTNDQQTLAALRNQESTLLNQVSVQQQAIAYENSSYQNQKRSLDNSIASYESNLASVNKEDSNFSDMIETVTGNVSVNRVSLWQLAEIFSPISPVIIIIILVILLWIGLRRIGFIPRVEWH